MIAESVAKLLLLTRLSNTRSSRIPNRRMLEIAHDSSGRSLEFLHEAAGQRTQFEPVFCWRTDSEFGFQVAVEHFVGVGLGRVRWQVEQLDQRLATVQPCLHIGRLVHAQVVYDQEDLPALGVGHQRREEVDEALGVDRPVMQRKLTWPRLVMAEIIVMLSQRARCRSSGVAPVGAKPRTQAMSWRTAVSSAQ